MTTILVLKVSTPGPRKQDVEHLLGVVKERPYSNFHDHQTVNDTADLESKLCLQLEELGRLISPLS